MPRDTPDGQREPIHTSLLEGPNPHFASTEEFEVWVISGNAALSSENRPSECSVREAIFAILKENEGNKDFEPYAPESWRKIFALVFGEDPTGPEDPRWDTLLAPPLKGLNALKILGALLKKPK
jgi:hypothetical protein